jgi:hypothetical protein
MRILATQSLQTNPFLLHLKTDYSSQTLIPEKEEEEKLHIVSRKTSCTW